MTEAHTQSDSCGSDLYEPVWSYNRIALFGFGALQEEGTNEAEDGMKLHLSLVGSKRGD